MNHRESLSVLQSHPQEHVLVFVSLDVVCKDHTETSVRQEINLLENLGDILTFAVQLLLCGGSLISAVYL